MLKKLGVIGGMGPEATSFYYARVIARTKAESDQEHINMIILSHATMPDRTQAILTGNKLPFLKAITQDARDLEMLQGYGYRVERACCVDMFPWSANVETVVLLSQQKPDDHIEIEINLDEIDATSAETKATYKEIEEWVQEHYGFHVTNLNIAQVKQKYGIIERENYNRPKSENSRRPGTTPEKEKAITEALKYFKMI